jgi:S1-C subfamily serine protease
VQAFVERVGDVLAGFTVLDWVLVALVVAFAVIGWVQGFVIGLLSLVGFVGGAALGLIFVPRLLSSLDPGLGTALLAILLVLLSAALGQWLLSSVGNRVRARLGGGDSVRRLDGMAGAALGAVGVLVVAWLVGSAVASATVPWLSREARDSTVLAAVDGVVPVDPEVVREPLREVVSSGGFPEVVAPYVPELIFAVDPPDPGADRSEGVRAALPSVVKVLGRAPSCSATLEGSGVVVEPGRVLTNAHVVAGTDRVVVAPADGEPVVADVVYLDSGTDVAVLAARELTAAPLALETDLVSPGADAVVAGYPGGGGLDTTSARVRSTSNVLGLDIYSDEEVLREVVAFRGQVRPGNSGGPLLSLDGQVIGLVFAASLTDPDTGYALAQSQLSSALSVAAAPEVTPVATTGACA